MSNQLIMWKVIKSTTSFQNDLEENKSLEYQEIVEQSSKGKSLTKKFSERNLYKKLKVI
jgi:hypothetical protein